MAAPTDSTPTSVKDSSAKEKDSVVRENDVFQDIWMLLPCSVYKLIHKDCQGWRAKLYNSYRDGLDKPDCTPMKEDYENCLEIAYNQSPKAYEKLLKKEQDKRLVRLESRRNNDVWEYRSGPPRGWFDNTMDNTVAEVDTDFHINVQKTKSSPSETSQSGEGTPIIQSSGRRTNPKIWLLRGLDDSGFCVIS